MQIGFIYVQTNKPQILPDILEKRLGNFVRTLYFRKTMRYSLLIRCSTPACSILALLYQIYSTNFSNDFVRHSLVSSFFSLYNATSQAIIFIIPSCLILSIYTIHYHRFHGKMLIWFVYIWLVRSLESCRHLGRAFAIFSVHQIFQPHTFYFLYLLAIFSK